MKNFIFGFGSVINDESRLITRRIDYEKHDDHTNNNSNSGSGKVQIQVQVGGSCDNAIAASINSCVYKREWCFKSCTGFTALGVQIMHPNPNTSSYINTNTNDRGIFGILFPVNTDDELLDFDVREVNYHRVCVEFEDITLLPKYGCYAAQERALSLQSDASFNSEESMIWIYVPDEEHACYPSPEYPILTTYLDVCLIGCYEW